MSTTATKSRAPAAHALSAMSIAEAWQRSRAMFEGPAMDDLALKAFSALETFVLEGPIIGSADVAAKIKAAATGYEFGERSDGAERRALAQAAEWLEAH